MRTNTDTPDGRGSDGFSDWLRRVRQRLIELQFYDSTTIAFEQTTRGVRAHVKGSNISGGGAATNPFVDFWDPTLPYAGGSIVQVPSPTTYNAIVIQPGTYALRQGLSTTAGPVYNSIPQYPYPTSAGVGNINTGYPVFPYCFWILIAFGPKIIGTCAGGSGVQEYANTTGTF